MEEDVRSLGRCQGIIQLLDRPHFFFFDRVLLCSLGWPGTHYVDQAGFELIEICLPLTLECCD